MKTTLLLLLAGSALATAAFETWTNADGKTAELELTGVEEVDGEKVGSFRMAGGRTVTLKASQLSEADAQRLAEWQPEAAEAATEASVYAEILDGNLESLQGRSLKRLKEFTPPTEYYLFYHTASWCGPCQRFTPSLVEFYEKHKPGDARFEIILLSSDRSDDAMEEYAKDKKMTWPHLKLSKVEDFEEDFPHPGGGIPNLVPTDTQGKLLKTSYVDGKYVGPNVVMHHLGTLLAD